MGESVQEAPRTLQPPPGAALREYQMVGLQWMVSLYNNHLNGILADEMVGFRFQCEPVTSSVLDIRVVPPSIAMLLVRRQNTLGTAAVAVFLSGGGSCKRLLMVFDDAQGPFRCRGWARRCRSWH